MTEWPAGGAGEMFSLINDLPAQLAASGSFEGLTEVAPPAGGFSRILLCGMGGSAISGDLVQPLIQSITVNTL